MQGFKGMRRVGPVLAAIAVLLMLGSTAAWADTFRIALTQASSGAAKKYRPLEAYLKSKGIDVRFVAARDYPDAARMFAEGQVEGMFCGSGVAGSMIIKELATPLLRPVSQAGHSTYWAVVIAPRGTAAFDGSGEFFRGKKVLAARLASSGEIFYRAVPGIGDVDSTYLPAANHGAAIDALAKGAADLAIVKVWVWEAMKEKYPQLELVGQDRGENPDGTLIIANQADSALVAKVGSAIFGINEDSSAAAEAVRDAMKLRVFTKTTVKDFEHTLGLLQRAGVDKSFNFTF
jgi:ABC-type phosphate/phosphonate transport system substrate-binding protein